MAKRNPFGFLFTPEAIEHFDWIEIKDHGLIRRTIKDQLAHVPTNETRNRKPMEQPAPFNASWELLGPDNRYRVLYDVDLESHMVHVLAVGVKYRNRLIIGGEVYES